MPPAAAWLPPPEPKAPNKTLVTGRFIALHMSSVSSVPDEPTSVPATIIERLLMTKPSPATARPVKELSSEMTTGMSAPPMGMTIAMPNKSASANMTINAVELVWPLIKYPHKPRITSSTRPFKKFWPGNVCGLSNFPSSFKNAIILPENDNEPMSVANNIGTAADTVTPSRLCERRRNSRLATSAADPPPRPLNAATICGIAVILTEYAPIAPMTRPITMPTAMSVQLRFHSCSCISGIVAKNATTMPAAARRFP